MPARPERGGKPDPGPAEGTEGTEETELTEGYGLTEDG